MSAPDEMNAWSPAAKSVQQGTRASSSQEHYQVPVRRNDGTAAVREAVLEGRIGAGKTGSSSPGGGQQKPPIQTAKKKYGISVNKHQEQRRGSPTPSPACRSPKVSVNGRQKSETRGAEVKGSLQLCAGRECHRNVSRVAHRSVPVNGSVVWAWCV